MSKQKIIFIIIMVITLMVFISGSTVLASYCDYKTEKRAIIIVPGLFASGLYDSATGNYVWDPFEEINLNFSDIMNGDGINLANIINLLTQDCVIEELNKLIANDNSGTPDSLFNMMAMNEDGTSQVETIAPVPWTDSMRHRYGVANAQKDMYDSLNNRYGKNYEVQVFNYDFRKDSRDNALLLENYINGKGYTDIILVSHSNGGIVSSIYLARSEENRQKVSKYISYNVPYYGSYSAITILEDLEGMISDVTDALSGIPALSGNITELFNKQFSKLVNMYAPYHLLPSFELLSHEYNGEKCEISIDGVTQEFTNQEDLWEFYCSRPWAVMSDGELRPAISEWIDFRDSMFVTLDDGSKVISTSLVDTTYFTGDNVEGDFGVNLITQGNLLVKDTTSKTMRGDGTVLYTSAVAFESDTEKICILDGVNHYGVNYGFYDVAENETYAVIDKFLEERNSFMRKWWY